MNEISVLRADYYSDGTIHPLLISFSDGSSEHISLVRSVKWKDNGKECEIHCTTPTKELILHFRNSRWRITYVEF